jgi:hypothetical protein
VVAAIGSPTAVAAEGEGGGSTAVPGLGRVAGRLLHARRNDQEAHGGVGDDHLVGGDCGADGASAQCPRGGRRGEVPGGRAGGKEGRRGAAAAAAVA